VSIQSVPLVLAESDSAVFWQNGEKRDYSAETANTHDQAECQLKGAGIDHAGLDGDRFNG
jgi:hypothetical protein